MEQRKAVLPPRQGHKDAVTVLDQTEIPDGPPRKTPDIVFPARCAVHGLNPNPDKPELQIVNCLPFGLASRPLSRYASPVVKMYSWEGVT